MVLVPISSLPSIYGSRDRLDEHQAATIALLEGDSWAAEEVAPSPLDVEQPLLLPWTPKWHQDNNAEVLAIPDRTEVCICIIA